MHPKPPLSQAALRDGTELPSSLPLPLVGPDDLGIDNQDNGCFHFHVNRH